VEAQSPGKETMSIKIHSNVFQLLKQAILRVLVFLFAGCRPGVPPEPNPAQEDSTPRAIDQRFSQTSEQPSSEPATESRTAKAIAEERSTETPDTEDAGQTIHYGTVEEQEIVLPIGWEAVSLGATEIRDRLGSHAMSGSDVAVYAFWGAIDDETRVLVAAFTGPRDAGTPQPIMTMSVIPRHKLQLSQYVEEFAAGLGSVSGIEVARAGLIYDVRTDGTPVGIVAYELPPSEREPDLTGYHLVQFDAGGENLVTMTWLATSDVIESMLDDIHATAATIGPTSTSP
jgi:hypothetical protein